MAKKKEETKKILGRIYDYTLEEIMGDRFGQYAKDIIQNRAIPDVRDGLKPVQRRILYAMFRDKNTYDKAHKKSATAVCMVITVLWMVTLLLLCVIQKQDYLK